MFPDRLNPADDRAEDNIYLAHESHFDRQYVKHSSGSFLTQARPDRVNAYLSFKIANGRLPTPFTKEEEQVLNEGNIHPRMFCPWLTAQFKSTQIGLLVASLQGARDGVAVQNYLFTLFRRAGITPTIVDTLHWSLACNTQTVQLFCHWRGEDSSYHIHEFCSASLRASFQDLDRYKDMVRMRMYLRNILEWSQYERLDRIRQIVAVILKKRDIEAANLAQAEARVRAQAVNVQSAATRRVKAKTISRRSGTTAATSVAFSAPTDEGYGRSRQHETSPRNTSGRTSGSSSKRRRSEHLEDGGSADELA
ncbi:hypothetical protein N0V95_000504 [Ascochyta clinopodiicola]|nr:hypothetical protein N0V95_000504 [Ascochyta clinopodiicola]